MRTAYVFGPITGHGERFLPVYKRATQVCEKYYDKVIGSWPDFWKPEADRRAYFERIRQTIVNADLFVGELTQPSHGVGMELQMACDRNIPLIGLAEAGAKISDLVVGLPNLRRVIHYGGLDAMAGELSAELQRLTGRTELDQQA